MIPLFAFNMISKENKHNNLKDSHSEKEENAERLIIHLQGNKVDFSSLMSLAKF